MKSVRLDPDTEARLREAARLARVPESQIIRDGIVQRCEALLADRLDHQLAGLIGTLSAGGGRARRAHENFAKLLKGEPEKSMRGGKSRSRS